MKGKNGGGEFKYIFDDRLNQENQNGMLVNFRNFEF